MVTDRVEEIEKAISDVMRYCFERAESRVEIVVHHGQVLFAERLSERYVAEHSMCYQPHGIFFPHVQS